MSRIHHVSALLSVLALVSGAPAVLQAARSSSGCRLEVVVDGRTAAEYNALGTRYIEAIKGKDYAIRIHNPFDVRVATAARERLLGVQSIHCGGQEVDRLQSPGRGLRQITLHHRSSWSALPGGQFNTLDFRVGH